MSDNSQFDTDKNPTQPLPDNPSPPDNVTPFDTQLVDDAHAPRHTQPLPSQTPTYAPRSLPRQVLPDNDTTSSTNDTTSSTQAANQAAPAISPSIPSAVAPQGSPNVSMNAPTATLPASRLPTGTIIGLAAIGGALAVAFGSVFFQRLTPVPETTRNDSTVIIESKPAPSNPNTIILQRPDEDAETSDPKTTSPPKKSSDATNQTDNSAPLNANSSTNDNEYSNNEYSNNESNPASDENDARRVDPNDETPSNAVSAESPSSDNFSSDAAARFTERRRAYSIQPPREFRLTQKGRRTIWKGSSGAQLLVEVGSNNGETPRAGWEKLDRALQKKYGSRYQNRGIRDTTLNGREAATWEFDLTQKDGTVVRKMDVAVVNGPNGYAVLASAPVEKFEAMRPTFNRVLDSFQIEPNPSSGSAANNLNDKSSNDAVAPGF